MVTCNIVYDDKIDWNSEDGKTIEEFKNIPCVNVVSDITFLKTEAPTLFYGYRNAVKNCGPFDKSSRVINKSYAWTYSKGEVDFECWVDEFVNGATESWFKYVDNGIDVVFDELDIDAFGSKLGPWPLIHDGNYEIYIADWNNGEIIIHSIKKDTLEYVGIKPDEFMESLAEILDYKFLTFEADRYWNQKRLRKKNPIFIDLLLEAAGNQWMGIKEIIDQFSNVKIDRKKVIVYYLKQSEYLRPEFNSIVYR